MRERETRIFPEKEPFKDKVVIVTGGGIRYWALLVKMVVEVPAKALSLVGKNSIEGIGKYQNLIQDHERIVNTVRGLLI